MKIVIVYDSVYGNTEELARAMASSLSEEVIAKRSDNISLPELSGADLLIIGAPTQGGRYTPRISEFLNALTEETIKAVCLAVFDTRIPGKWVKIFGYASNRIASVLKNKGGKILVNPEGFWVEKTRGPIVKGEIERAIQWTRQLVTTCKEQRK